MLNGQTELADLITAVAGADRTAFRRLYEITSPKLFGIVQRIIRDNSLAEDILQDVFLRIWRNAGSFSSEAGPPMAWLGSIARNRTIDILRQRTLSEHERDDTDWYERVADPRDPEADMMDISSLRYCLGEVDEPARSCVLLAYYEGFSREELAQRFARPVNTVKTWLHRALGALKTCLEQHA